MRSSLIEQGDLTLHKPLKKHSKEIWGLRKIAKAGGRHIAFVPADDGDSSSSGFQVEARRRRFVVTHHVGRGEILSTKCQCKPDTATPPMTLADKSVPCVLDKSVPL